jgi:hypothetical protein
MIFSFISLRIGLQPHPQQDAEANKQGGPVVQGAVPHLHGVQELPSEVPTIRQQPEEVIRLGTLYIPLLFIIFLLLSTFYSIFNYYT